MFFCSLLITYIVCRIYICFFLFRSFSFIHSLTIFHPLYVLLFLFLGSLLGRLLGSFRSSSSSSSHPPLATVSSPLLALGPLFTSYNPTTGLPSSSSAVTTTTTASGGITQQPQQSHHHPHLHQQALPHYFFGSPKGNYNLALSGDPDGSSRDSILLLRSSEDGTNNGLDSESDNRDRSFR